MENAMSELTRTHHQHLSPSTLHLLDHLLRTLRAPLRGLDILALRMSPFHLGLQDLPHICRTSVNGATSTIRHLVCFQISGEDRNEEYLSACQRSQRKWGRTSHLVEIVALQGIIQERLHRERRVCLGELGIDRCSTRLDAYRCVLLARPRGSDG